MPAVALTWLRRNWFLLGILTALLLGFLLPGLGSALNRGGIVRTVLIVLAIRRATERLKLPEQKLTAVFFENGIDVLNRVQRPAP